MRLNRTLSYFWFGMSWRTTCFWFELSDYLYSYAAKESLQETRRDCCTGQADIKMNIRGQEVQSGRTVGREMKRWGVETRPREGHEEQEEILLGDFYSHSRDSRIDSGVSPPKHTTDPRVRLSRSLQHGMLHGVICMQRGKEESIGFHESTAFIERVGLWGFWLTYSVFFLFCLPASASFGLWKTLWQAQTHNFTHFFVSSPHSSPKSFLFTCVVGMFKEQHWNLLHVTSETLFVHLTHKEGRTKNNETKWHQGKDGESSTDVNKNGRADGAGWSGVITHYRLRDMQR